MEVSRSSNPFRSAGLRTVFPNRPALRRFFMSGFFLDSTDTKVLGCIHVDIINTFPTIMSKHKKIKLSIRGGGLSYIADINPETAGKIMEICLTVPQQNNAVSSKSSVPTHEMPSQESLVEYVSRHSPRRNPDKILTVAGYIKEILQKSFFHPNEIRNLFRDAGEMLPANFNRDFRWAIRSAWIAKDPAKKNNFYVTNTGLKVLSGGFPDELVKKSKNKAGGRRKNKSGKK